MILPFLVFVEDGVTFGLRGTYLEDGGGGGRSIVSETKI
jgi:hypothetical protein